MHFLALLFDVVQLLVLPLLVIVLELSDAYLVDQSDAKGPIIAEPSQVDVSFYFLRIFLPEAEGD